MEKNDSSRKNLNYPMLLLALFSLANTSKIIRCVLSLFSSSLSNSSILLILFVYCAPLLVALLLGKYRSKGAKGVPFVIAFIFLALALAEAHNWILHIISVLPDISFEIEFVIWNLPSLIEPFFVVITYAILSMNLFTKKNNYIAFYIVSVLYIIELCFFGIIRTYEASIGMGLMSTALSGFIQIFLVLAVWYIPKAINNPSAAELSAGKAIALVIIAAIVIGIYLIVLHAVGDINLQGAISVVALIALLDMVYFRKRRSCNSQNDK